MRGPALALMLVLLSAGAHAETGTAPPDADFTRMPIEQEGVAHGTPGVVGASPEGEGEFVGEGTSAATRPDSAGAADCEPAGTDCPATR